MNLCRPDFAAKVTARAQPGDCSAVLDHRAANPDIRSKTPVAGKAGPPWPDRSKVKMPSFAAALETTLHHALTHASERRHEYATLEHLLLALIDDEHAAKVMQACGVRSAEHTSELQSLMRISYAVFCLQKQIHTAYKYNQTYQN